MKIWWKLHAGVETMFNRVKQSFPKGVAKSRANYEDLMENACGNTSDVKQGFPRGVTQSVG